MGNYNVTYHVRDGIYYRFTAPEDTSIPISEIDGLGKFNEPVYLLLTTGEIYYIPKTTPYLEFFTVYNAYPGIVMTGFQLTHDIWKLSLLFGFLLLSCIAVRNYFLFFLTLWIVWLYFLMVTNNYPNVTGPWSNLVNQFTSSAPLQSISQVANSIVDDTFQPSWTFRSSSPLLQTIPGIQSNTTDSDLEIMTLSPGVVTPLHTHSRAVYSVPASHGVEMFQRGHWFPWPKGKMISVLAGVEHAVRNTGIEEAILVSSSEKGDVFTTPLGDFHRT
jgi:quercetin dioxygenase-like cupin family protein